jgi:hypothetical protein
MNSVNPSIPSAPPKKSRLWLWFVGAFLVQLAAWAAWFAIAAQHKVQEVPLVGAVSSQR